LSEVECDLLVGGFVVVGLFNTDISTADITIERVKKVLCTVVFHNMFI